MLSLEEIQEFILAEMKAAMEPAVPVWELFIPDTKTVKRNSYGQIYPYVAIQFGDIQQEGSRNMAGTRGDNFIMPVYAQSIGPTAQVARRVSNKFVDNVLGLSVPYGGQVRKRPGGGMYPLISSTGAQEAAVFPISLGIPLQILNV